MGCNNRKEVASESLVKRNTTETKVEKPKKEGQKELVKCKGWAVTKGAEIVTGNKIGTFMDIGMEKMGQFSGKDSADRHQHHLPERRVEKIGGLKGKVENWKE